MEISAKIYTFTRIHMAAETFKDETPFVIAIIEEAGNRFLARIQGNPEVQIGDLVEKTEVTIGDQPVYKLK